METFLVPYHVTLSYTPRPADSLHKGIIRKIACATRSHVDTGYVVCRLKKLLCTNGDLHKSPLVDKDRQSVYRFVSGEGNLFPKALQQKSSHIFFSLSRQSVVAIWNPPFTMIYLKDK